MAVKIQFRRDTSTNRASQNPILAIGELGLVTDTGAYKIGDGVNNWNNLPYHQLSPEVTTLLMTAQNDPSPPAANNLVFYSKKIANRMLPKFIGPAGLDSALQPLLARNKVGYWCPPGSATTVPGIFGFTAYTVVGTATARTVAITNMFTRMRRLGFVSSATAGNLGGARAAIAQITLGDGNGLGGFFKLIRFGQSDAAFVTGARMFVGVSASTSVPTNVEPSTLLNSIGVGHRAADTNLKLFYGGSVAQTPIDLGENFPITPGNTDVYELALFAPPGSNNIVYYEVTRLNTGHVATGTLTGTAGVALPAYNTLLTHTQAWRCNNATALAVGLDIMSDYIETDT